MVRPFVEILVYDQVDFISGDRMKFRTDKNYTTLHYVGNSILNKVAGLLFKVSMNDSQSGMWEHFRTYLQDPQYFCLS